MTDLATWLLEQIDRDEAICREEGETHTLGCVARVPYEWDHECRCGFAGRVLAECDAKRRIIDEHLCPCPDPKCGDCNACSGDHHADPTPSPCRTLKLLALPYADRPGYREEWTP